jgi:hypothetical protein
MSSLALPDETDPEAIFRFAMTFNGYEHFGSVAAATQAAQEKRRASLEDLRNELFFAARASRHYGDDAYIQLYRELAPLFRAWLGAAAAPDPASDIRTSG